MAVVMVRVVMAMPMAMASATATLLIISTQQQSRVPFFSSRSLISIEVTHARAAIPPEDAPGRFYYTAGAVRQSKRSVSIPRERHGYRADPVNSEIRQ